jgi:anti-sigma factor RsiW
MNPVCESWKGKLDGYFDAELAPDEMRAFDAHLRSCPSCAADSLAHVQMKRTIHTVGKRFTPTAEFRKKIQQGITKQKPRRAMGLGRVWIAATATVATLAIIALIANFGLEKTRSQRIYSELADLHVATLASSSPVDVVSTDRHTVKPWFQGKIPFAFDLPDLQNSEFSLLGGRMAYLEQSPGAHLVYQLRKHQISVFIFPDAPLRKLAENKSASKQLSFSTETWSRGGLRYFVIGDAAPSDIDSLAKRFKSIN